MSQLAFFEDHKPDQGDFLSDMLAGLAKTPKSISPKYLYDERGAKLFEDICRTDDYYVTRTEIALLRKIGNELAAMAGPNANLVEFGMGDGQKARMILNMLQEPSGLIGIDICREQLHDRVKRIAREFPSVEVGGICADFFNVDRLPENKNAQRNIGFFPGSTIGNFLPDEQETLMRSMSKTLGAQGGLIIGVDLKKDARRIHAAYDDGQGITAAFTLNLITRINRELNAEIDQSGFKHEAVYNEPQGCIEICLRSLRDQTLSIGAHQFTVRKDEPIHTEKSYKFTIPQFQDFARATGFLPRKSWTDKDQLFSIHWLDVA